LRQQLRYSHQFVEFVPDVLEEGVLYVSMAYATAVHKCACGCGQEVVTPLSPTDWQLSFNGEAVSLDPSIGNWSFPCRSHYYIRRGVVRWAGNMSDAAIQRGRAVDSAAKAEYYAQRQTPSSPVPRVGSAGGPSDGPPPHSPGARSLKSRWDWLIRLFR
jgi:Family of unknown function (DUF6527)